MVDSTPIVSVAVWFDGVGLHRMEFFHKSGASTIINRGTGYGGMPTFKFDLTGKLIGFRTEHDAGYIVGIQPMIDTTVDCNDVSFQFADDISTELGSTGQTDYTLTYKYVLYAAHHCTFTLTSYSGVSFVTLVEDMTPPRSSGESWKINISANSPSQLGPHTLDVVAKPDIDGID